MAFSLLLDPWPLAGTCAGNKLVRLAAKHKKECGRWKGRTEGTAQSTARHAPLTDADFLRCSVFWNGPGSLSDRRTPRSMFVAPTGERRTPRSMSVVPVFLCSFAILFHSASTTATTSSSSYHHHLLLHLRVLLPLLWHQHNPVSLPRPHWLPRASCRRLGSVVIVLRSRSPSTQWGVTRRLIDGL